MLHFYSSFGMTEILRNNLQGCLLHFLFIYHFQLSVNGKSEKNSNKVKRLKLLLGYLISERIESVS